MTSLFGETFDLEAGRLASMVRPDPSDQPAGLIYSGPSQFSGHGIDEYGICPQRWVFLYSRIEGPDGEPINLGVAETIQDVGDDQEALVRGNLGHQGLALHYRRMQARQAGEDESRWLEPLKGMEALANWRGGLYRDNLERMQDCMVGYLRWAALQDRGIRVVGVEGMEGSGFYGEVGESRSGHSRSGDSVWEIRGKLYPVDHKTKVRELSDFVLAEFVNSGQFIDYAMFGRRRWGERFGGVILNLLKHGSNEEKIDFRREVIHVTDFQIRERVRELRRRYDERARLVAEGRHPLQWPKAQGLACWAPFRRCPALRACTEGVAGVPEGARAVIPLVRRTR